MHATGRRAAPQVASLRDALITEQLEQLYSGAEAIKCAARQLGAVWLAKAASALQRLCCDRAPSDRQRGVISSEREQQGRRSSSADRAAGSDAALAADEPTQESDSTLAALAKIEEEARAQMGAGAGAGRAKGMWAARSGGREG